MLNVPAVIRNRVEVLDSVRVAAVVTFCVIYLQSVGDVMRTFDPDETTRLKFPSVVIDPTFERAPAGAGA